MNKNYVKPTMRVVNLQQRMHIICASTVNSVSNNAGLGYGRGASDVSARSRGGGWDDEDFE